MNLLVAIADSPDSEVCLREVATRQWPNDTQVRAFCRLQTRLLAPRCPPRVYLPRKTS